MPRAPGRIDSDGDRDAANMLVAALRAPGVDVDIAESLTHPFHSYPARMHPATARVLVEALARRGAPVVDPFCGSGTVLVEARSLGARAIGSDLNPLACLVAYAKTWTQPPKRRLQLREAGHEIAGEVLAAGKAARRSGNEAPPLRKPAGWDPNARNRRLASWFAPHVRRELELMMSLLDELRERDRQLADVLTACVSAILYKVSSRTSDTDNTWVARNIGRGATARHFVQRVDLLVSGLSDMAQRSGTPPEIHELDARRLGTVVPDGSAGAIVTSPPYAGTYDYAEHQRLRFDFLALHHRDFDDGEIGARRSFKTNSREGGKVWQRALADSLDSITRALMPGGAAAIVIGDSIASGHAIYALDDVRSAITGDIEIQAWASQHRPMLGGVETRAFGDRPKAEHIILLRKR